MIKWSKAMAFRKFRISPLKLFWRLNNYFATSCEKYPCSLHTNNLKLKKAHNGVAYGSIYNVNPPVYNIAWLYNQNRFQLTIKILHYPPTPLLYDSAVFCIAVSVCVVQVWCKQWDLDQWLGRDYGGGEEIWFGWPLSRALSVASFCHNVHCAPTSLLFLQAR